MNNLTIRNNKDIVDIRIASVDLNPTKFGKIAIDPAASNAIETKLAYRRYIQLVSHRSLLYHA